MEWDFADFITDLAHGAVHQRLTDKLRELVTACEETKQAGKLQLTIAVKPEGQMATSGIQIKASIPEHQIPGTLFWFSGDGRLLREDPRQMELKKITDDRGALVALPEREIDNGC